MTHCEEWTTGMALLIAQLIILKIMVRLTTILPLDYS